LSPNRDLTKVKMFTSIPRCARLQIKMISYHIDPLRVPANTTILSGGARRRVPQGVYLLGGRVWTFGFHLIYPLSFCDPAGQPFPTKEPMNNSRGPSLQYWDMPASDRLNRAIDQLLYLLDGINRQVNGLPWRVGQEPIPGREKN
jgi:hypothetical protein